jgi:hypothetical protein
VNGRFEKPEGVVGPYLIVAVDGADFESKANGDRDMVAVDLSASRMRTLPVAAFCGCTQLAAVAFPPELEIIRTFCFSDCGALHVVHLTATQLKALRGWVFADCGVTRVSVPPSLRETNWRTFAKTLLKILDLSECDGLRIESDPGRSLVEVSLPREGFMAAAKTFLQGSRVEVLLADVDETELNKLVPQLDWWESTSCGSSHLVWESTFGSGLGSPCWLS